MANRLDTRWDTLAVDPLHSVFQLYDADHPMDFYIGRDINHHPLLLLVTPEVPPIIRDLRAISIQTFRRDDGKCSLLLTLSSIPLTTMFSMLCEDLIESSRNISFPADKSLSFVLKRLSNWRKLLERGLPGLLTEGQIRGLSGELLFLRRLSALQGKSGAVKAWVGPKRADQDFQTPDAAWEIKVIRPEARTISISSESQLQTLARPVYLVVIELADDTGNGANAFTLNTLVSDIRASLAEDYESCELFEENLAATGYLHRPEYDTLIFVERSLVAFAVLEGFPRITGEMLAPGINCVSYDVLLSACDKFLIHPHEIMNKRIIDGSR